MCKRKYFFPPSFSPKKLELKKADMLVKIPEELTEGLLVATGRIEKKKWELSKKICSLVEYNKMVEEVLLAAQKIETWVRG